MHLCKSETQFADRIRDAYVVLTNEVALDAMTPTESQSVQFVVVTASVVDEIDLNAYSIIAEHFGARAEYAGRFGGNQHE